MEKLQLNEEEINVFFEMFDQFDNLRCGKLEVETVRKILSFAGLTSSDLNQVLSLSGALKTGYFGRSHFFMALKLVALVQNGFELTPESLSDNACKLPLPKLDIPRGLDNSDSILAENIEMTNDKSMSRLHNSEEIERAGKQFDQSDIQFDEGDKCDCVLLTDEQSCAEVTLDKRETCTDNNWISKDEDEERGLLSGEQAKKSSEILASFHIEKSQKGQKTKALKSDTLLNELSSNLHSSSTSQMSSDTLTSTSTQSLCNSNPESPSTQSMWSKISNNGSSWAYQDLNDADSKVACVSDAREPDFVAASKKNRLEMPYLKPYLPNNPESPPFHSDQRSHKNERRRRWIGSFALNPKREAEYLVQFNELFISADGTKALVSPSEVTQLFGAQFNLSASDFEEIWNMADLDHDGFLNKVEFCLASHLARLHAYEGLSLEDAMEASLSYANHLNLQTNSRVHHGSPQMSPDSAEYPLMCMNRREQDLSSENEQLDCHDDASHCSRPGSGHYRLIGTGLEDSKDYTNDDADHIPEDDSDSLNESVDDHGDAALLPKHKSSTEFLSCEDIPRSSNERDRYASLNRNSDESNSRSSSSCSSFDSSDSTNSPYVSGSTSDSDQNIDDSVLSTTRNFGTRHGVNRSVDPIHLLSVTTGRQTSALSSLSSVQRRRLLCSLIREAKSLNHTLLRLNNEMQGELKELNDQCVNLSVQLQHLGLQPSASTP